MIVTLTPNPSIDRTVTLTGALARGQVHRVDSVTSQGGGKGVNISRVCVGAGQPTVAVLPAAADDPFVAELVAAGIDCRPARPAGAIRVNLTITEPDGTTTKLNSPGATVEGAHLEAMRAALLEAAATADWVVLAGSLPPGAPPEFYADVVRSLHGTGARVAVDTSEAPLRALVDALPDAAPDLMKPNGDELASLTGEAAALLEADPARAAAAARSLVERGVGAVLATLGGNGAVLVTADGAWHATPPPTTVRSTVGAGDSSLFGYILGDVRGLPPTDRLVLAVAYGSAAAGLVGTTMPRPSDLRTELVSVSTLAPTAPDVPQPR